MSGDTRPQSKKRSAILRSSSSGALLKATHDIRRRHQHLFVDVGKKNAEPSSISSSRETIVNYNPEDTKQVVKMDAASEIRRRRSDKNRTLSLPSAKIYRSLSSISQSERNFDDDNVSVKSSKSCKSTRKLFPRSNEMLVAKHYEKALNGILERNMQSRKQDEAMVSVEKQRYMKIMEMYEKYFERTNSSKRATLDNEPDARSQLLCDDTATSSGVNFNQSKCRYELPSSTTSSCKDFEASIENESSEVLNRVKNNMPDNSKNAEERQESDTDEIKQKINELETQISKSTSEFEMERALLEIKITAERKCLTEEENNCEKIKVKIIELEEDYITKREKYHDQVQEKNSKLQSIQEKISEAEKQIEKSPESLRECMEENLNKDIEKMKEEMKNLEDAEFDMLETMSNFDEEKEKLQRNLILEKKKLDFKINNRKSRLKMLQNQLVELERKEKQENQRLFQDRDAAIGMLQQQQQNKTSSLESDFYQNDLALPSSFSTKASSDLPHHSSKSRRLMSLESFLDSISISEKSEPIIPKLHEKLIEASNVSSVQPVKLRHPRRSFNYGDEVLQSEQTHKKQQSSYSNQTKNANLKDSRISLFSTDSVDSSMSFSTSVDDEKLREMKRLLAEAQAKKEILLHDIVRKYDATSIARNSMHGSTTSHGYDDSVKDEEEDSDTTLQKDDTEVKLRASSKRKRQNRPMSRYLPNRSSDFNLREHIESCGHNPTSCRHIVLTATSCSGYLSKKGGKLRSWKKRWFVFDRIQKLLIIYSEATNTACRTLDPDKRETKEKGKILFQSIEDVFIDHLKAHKNTNPSLTFCIKCNERFHYFSAPSSDAMSIWMDVLVTGAEGYREYMKTIDRISEQKK